MGFDEDIICHLHNFFSDTDCAIIARHCKRTSDHQLNYRDDTSLAQISGCKFQNLSQISFKIRGVWSEIGV